jgi:hypothetical protein
MPMLGVLPVVHASTGVFGYTAKGGNTTNSGSPIKCNYSLLANAYILSFTVYVNNPSPSSSEWIEVGIYNGNVLIEYNKTLTDKFSTGWVTFTFPSVEWLEAGTYALAVKQITSSNSTPPTTTIYYDQGSLDQTGYIDWGTCGRTTDLENPWIYYGILSREYSEYVTYATSLSPSPPTYSGISYTTSCIGCVSTFSITVSDPVGLSKYIFSFDNGVSTLTNGTARAFSADPQTVYVNETLTSTLGATIRFQWFFNDTSNL